jgi:DNA-binding MarR family transcriptional regulator
MTPTVPLRILSPLHRAMRQISLHMEVEMDGVGAAQGDCHLLAYLASYAPCRVGELVRVFGLKRSTVTSALDRLEEQGTLERDVDPEDRRSFLVSLTGAGRAVAAEANRRVRRFERRLLARISARDLAGFEAVMGTIEEVSGVRVRPARREKQS